MTKQKKKKEEIEDKIKKILHSENYKEKNKQISSQTLKTLRQ
jgi:hypothetical protein